MCRKYRLPRRLVDPGSLPAPEQRSERLVLVLCKKSRERKEAGKGGNSRQLTTILDRGSSRDRGLNYQ